MFVSKHKLKLYEYPVALRYEVANNQPVYCTHYVKAHLSIQQFSCFCNLTVMPELVHEYDILLGADWLTVQGALVDYIDKSLTLRTPKGRPVLLPSAISKDPLSRIPVTSATAKTDTDKILVTTRQQKRRLQEGEEAGAGTPLGSGSGGSEQQPTAGSDPDHDADSDDALKPSECKRLRHLAFAEFAINNSWQESIQSTPFLVNYGQSPITPMLHKLPRPCLSPSAESFAKKWEHEVKHAQECMRVAQDRQERYENKRRRDVTFSVGDSVLLSTKNLRNAPGKARKFLPRQVRFKKRMEYLVKWTGYDDTYNTWEPEANLAGAPQILSRASLTPALPSKEYADDLTIVVLDRVRDGKVVVEALGLFRAAGGPALRVSKSSALPCAQPEPGPGNQEGTGPEGAGRGGRGGDGGEGGGQGQVGELGGGAGEGGGQGQQQGGQEQGGEQEPEVVIPAVRVGVPVRHLGVPLGAASYAATSEAAFGGAAAAMMADSLPWRPQGLNLLGRVQVAQQCLASKSIYQMAFVQPSAPLAQAMALAVNRCVAASDLPPGAQPQQQPPLPQQDHLRDAPGGGRGGASRPGGHQHGHAGKDAGPPLTHSLLADPSHGLSTWIINDPTAPPSRGISPRLQAHVAALAELKLFRAVPPASQSFFSVLAEALWYNAQVRLNPAAREAAAERGWTHFRHVREALHSPQLEGEARWAADLVRACPPEPLQGMVDRLQPPQPEWEYLRVGPGVGFVLRRTPMLQPSHWVGPNGHLYPLDPTGQAARGALWSEEGAAWEPAAVDRLNKPSYRLTPEERATHLCPLPAQRHVEQEQAQGQEQGEAKGVGRGGGRARGRGGGRGRGRGGGEGLRGTGGGGNGQAADPAEEGPGTWPKEEWLLGPWAHRQLDPHVWGMGITTLLDLSVKHARVRLHQLQRVSADPSYLPGGGLWPALWGVRPPRAAGDPEVTTVADGALRELEHKWEASAQQVAGQGAAEEREERLHEEVQGSQPPRWLNTSAKAAVARAHLVRQLVRVEREGEAEVQAAQHLGEASARAGVGAREQGAQQSLLASAVLDQYYGDRSSFYFYHRDQPAHTPTPISSLQLPSQPGQLADLTTLAGVKAACRAFQQHYSAAEPTGVYAAKPMDTAARVTLLGSLTSHLTPTQARAAEGSPKQYGSPLLSEEELGRALQGCAHSKAPGLDGLPLEVYDRLWVELGRPLRATLQEALADTADPAPLAEFQTGIITLVPKAGKPRDQVAGYRPITLLDCDVRLVARAVEDRLQLPLDLLVSPSQSAFILGRDISDSVQFHLGLLEYLQQRGSPAWLLLLDLAGAFNNVSWGLLGGQEPGARSQVLVNGHLTDSFLLASGLLQVSGASPLYWCIVLQPLVSYLSSLQLAGRISTPTIPSSPLAMHRASLTPALPSKEYADDLTIVVLDRVRDGKVVVEALGLFRAAGGPALSVSKSSALPCAQPEPGPGNQEGTGPEGAGRGGRGGDGGEGGGQGQVGELGGGAGEGGGQGQQQGGQEQGGEQEPEVVIPAVRVGVPVRHLGVPLGAASYAATSEAAFGGAAAAMMADSLPWRPQGLNLLGRVQVAQQCLASKSIYQMAFVQPSAPLAQAMALAVNRCVAASDLPPGAQPQQQPPLPQQDHLRDAPGGGRGGASRPGGHQHGHAGKDAGPVLVAPDPSHGLSTWIINDPTAPPSRGISPRLQAHVAALAELKLFRAVPPASQSFFSVLAEALWYNAQVRLNPAAREAAAERGWTHVRHVREALHSPQLEGEARWAADLVGACLPEPLQGMVDRLQPPQPEWEYLRVGPGVGFVLRRTPMLQPSHWVGPNGHLYPLDPTGQAARGTLWSEEGAAWEPAAVDRLNKPSYRLTPEERATHLCPLPAQRHVEQEQAQGQEQGEAKGEEWLLGPWAHRQLDPHVWGMGITTLLDLSVKHARLEHKWEASAQQVAGQGAAEEREERLHEEVQGSQPPRWLNTSAKAAVARAHLVRQLVRVEREGEAEVQAAQHLGEASARAGVGAREQGAPQSLLASAVLDQYYGDRSSFYFSHRDQPAHTPTPISSLQLPSQPGQLADLTTLAGGPGNPVQGPENPVQGPADPVYQDPVQGPTTMMTL
ncbi:hypothetical protein QJQ45_013078 [Haematococcus lacustris]|nr:hypothetical protein QJQ45_013078 [Haematococcus lacustris]